MIFNVFPRVSLLSNHTLQLADPTMQQLIMVDTHDVVGALNSLAGMVGAAPDLGSLSLSAPAVKRPRAPTGKLTATKLCAAVAYAQPGE